MDRIIEVKVFGNHLTKDSNRAGVRGEGNTTNLRITFDESWDHYAKEAIFWDAYGQNPTIITLTENPLEDKTTIIRTYLVPIPTEAMARAGMLTFVIKGITVQESKAEATEPSSEEPLIGKIQVSVTGKLEVEDSPEMLSPVNPTPNQLQQMQLQYNEILGDLQEVATAMEELPQFKTDMQSQVDKATERAKDAFDAKLAAQVASKTATAKSVVAEGYADSAASSAERAEDSAIAAKTNSDNAKGYADSAAVSAGVANENAIMSDTNVGILRGELSETKAEMEAHKASFDHPDKSITTEKIRDAAVTTEKIQDGAVTRDKLAPDSVTGGKIKEGSVGSLHIIDKNITTKKLADGAVTEEKIAKGAVTGDKIADETISKGKLNEDVISLIASNKFDGYIATIADADGIDNRDNPHNVRIFRVGRDNGKGEGGILIVSGDTNTLHEHHPLEGVEQTYITHDGYIKTRYAINWESYDGIVFEWSEWESRYLTHADITKLEELNARNAYFSTSLAAGNVDYEIIAYDMTGIFGGLPVEPLSVLVSPDNVGIWESLSIVYADINGVRCKLNRSDFATNDLTANQINGYTGDKKDWFVYWYIGSDYDFNSEELNTGKYDISMAVPKFKVDEYGNISASSLKLKYDDRAIQIVNTVEGESIAMPDSSGKDLKGLRLFGRTEQYTNGFQLFDVNDLIGGNLDNASLAINEDGSFTITNNTSQNAHFNYTKYIAVKSIFKTGKALSLKVYGATNVEVTLGFSDLGDIGIDGTYISNRAGGQDSFEMTQSILDNAASLTVLMNGTLDSSASETIKIMLYQDGDGTWEPFTGGIPAPTTEFPCKLVSVGDDGGVDVNVHGYQLFDASAIDGKESYGVTITNNGDGSFTVTGVANREFSLVKHYSRKEALKLLRAGQISLSNNGVYGYPYAYMSLFGTNGKYFEVNTSSATYKTKTITQEMLDDESLTMRIGIYIKNNDTTVTYLKPMLYQDGDDTWEPYKPIQTLTIPTPNGLPAVPVSSDGNYTDASGQQWECDEKDYDRDVYVTRTTKLVLNGNEDWKTWGVNNKAEGITAFYTYVAPTIPLSTANTSIICSHLPAVGGVYGGGAVGCGIFASATKPYVGISVSNDCLEDVSSNDAAIASFKKLLSESNMTVIYPKIPEETPLSEEEIAAYKALHTYYPSTSIHNSDNAHMAVDYVADTKNYVDNQIKKEVAELTAAILTQ